VRKTLGNAIIAMVTKNVVGTCGRYFNPMELLFYVK